MISNLMKLCAFLLVQKFPILLFIVGYLTCWDLTDFWRINVAVTTVETEETSTPPNIERQLEVYDIFHYKCSYQASSMVLDFRFVHYSFICLIS